jgi:DNA-binding NarL/FixJ family response regulator
MAARIVRCLMHFDVMRSAPHVSCPTLVMHARGDVRIPFEEGRTLASLIPGARFLPLDSPNHILLSHEPAFRQFFEELAAFLPGGEGGLRLESLTARENEILERIARGLDNTQIAAELGLSEKTVRNHVTRIFDKLGVASRPQAIVLARERGLGLGSRPS